MHTCSGHCAQHPETPTTIARLRDDFPALHQTVHGKPLVYLDNAATTQKPAAVIQALCEYFGTCNANVHRAFHYLAEQATLQYEETRRLAADFLGASAPREIIFTRGTTEAINLVAHGWGRKFLRAGDAILLSVMEHHSNLVPWQMLAAARDVELRFLPVLDDGTLDLDALPRLLDGRVKLLAVTQMSNVLGTINPVKTLIAAAHAAGALALVDAAQSAPHMPVSVRDLDCDFLACSGHKMCGPTGVGILYGRARLLEQMDPFLGGGEMIDRVTLQSSTWAEIPHKFEAGTPAIAEVIALGAALRYLDAAGRSALAEVESRLTARMLQALDALPGVRIFGRAPERGGAVSFDVAGVHPHDLAQFLDLEGIAIRAGHLCAQPLMQRFGVPAVNRASLYFYNLPEEADLLAAAILKARKYFAV